MKESTLGTDVFRPTRVSARDQGLGVRRDVVTQGAGPFGIQLGVEVVEEGDGGASGLLAVDVEAREGQGEKKAPGLAGGRLLGRVAAIEKKMDGVPVWSGEGASSRALTRVEPLVSPRPGPGVRRTRRRPPVA